MVLFVVTCICVLFDPCVHRSFVNSCPPVWLRPEACGTWAYFPSVADATAHLKEQGIGLFATQVFRAAKNAKMRNALQFCSTS